LKNQQGRGQQKGHTGPPRGNGQTRRNGSQRKNWHFTAPSPRDSETKEVDGKKVYWCGTCKHWNNTHTTDAHVRGAGGKRLSQGPSAQANLGFVDDPSGWIMDISNAKDLIYHLSIEVPLIIFVMILFSALVHVVSAGFTPMWSNFLLYGAQLSPFLIQLWTYLAPLLWLFLFGTTIYHGHRKPPDDNDPRALVVKSAPSPSSGAVSPASALSMPALLTLSSIAVILNVFVNKHVTLAGPLVLWKEKWLSSMIICIRLLCASLTPYVRTVEIL
jgi:hypothetical protein